MLKTLIFLVKNNVKFFALSSGLFISLAGLSQNYDNLNTRNFNPESEIFRIRPRPSQKKEITIISWKLKHFDSLNAEEIKLRNLSTIIKYADITVLQGIKIEKSLDFESKLNALILHWKLDLGPGWEIIQSTPYGISQDFAQYHLLVYRRTGLDNYTAINSKFQDLYELSDQNKLAIFSINFERKGVSKTFEIGSINLSDECSKKNIELLSIGNYAKNNIDNNFVLAGNLNFGSTFACNRNNRFLGENYLRNLHDTENFFLLFELISFGGEGKEIGFSSVPSSSSDNKGMLDQFIISNSLADSFAGGTGLGADCGWLDLNNILYTSPLKTELTYVSDHKPLWIQLKVF